MKRSDLEPGMVVKFQYELKNYKGQWMQHVGIIKKKNDRSLWTYCLNNGHHCVFTVDENHRGIKNIQLLPWSLV